MKVEIASMLNVWKWKLQIETAYVTMKIETYASRWLTMEIETATILNYENRNCKYAQLWK